MRFWKVPVKIPAKAPEGSARFPCRYLVTFRRVMAQWFQKVLVRDLVTFQKFPVQLPDEVPEGLGEDAW